MIYPSAILPRKNNMFLPNSDKMKITRLIMLLTNGPPVDEAFKTPQADKQKQVIGVVCDQLLYKRVFKEVDDLSEGKKMIGSKIILKEKLDEERKHLKFKACIVVQGFSQIPGVDYGETFSDPSN